jgi:S1-C subfamily serine protease
MYRAGYVSGGVVSANRRFVLLTINGAGGDSGAGVFSTSGELVGVISLIYQSSGNGYLKFMGMFPMRFTSKQWAEIK